MTNIIVTLPDGKKCELNRFNQHLWFPNLEAGIASFHLDQYTHDGKETVHTSFAPGGPLGEKVGLKPGEECVLTIGEHKFTVRHMTMEEQIRYEEENRGISSRGKEK